MEGLEPPRLSAPDPKSGAATNYATSAGQIEGAKISGDRWIAKTIWPFLALIYSNGTPLYESIAAKPNPTAEKQANPKGGKPSFLSIVHAINGGCFG